MEDNVPDIIECLAKVELDGEENRTRETEQKKVEAEEQRKWDIEWRRQYVEDEKRKALEQAAERWHHARQLRMFIRVCEIELQNQGVPPSGSASKQWLVWAHEHADRIDPLQKGYLGNLVKSNADKLDDD
jgi:hypothetical protein